MNNADKLEEEHICARAHACNTQANLHSPILPPSTRTWFSMCGLPRACDATALSSVPWWHCRTAAKKKKKKSLSVCRLVAVRSRGDQLISPVSSPVPLLLQHSLLHASAPHNGFTFNLTCHHLCTCVCLITPTLSLSSQHLLPLQINTFPHHVSSLLLSVFSALPGC